MLSGADGAGLESDHCESGHGRSGGNGFQRRRCARAAGESREQRASQRGSLFAKSRQAAELRAQPGLFKANELDIRRDAGDTTSLVAVSTRP